MTTEQATLNEPAFDAARREFGRMYAEAFTAHPPYDRGPEAHDESLTEALEAAIATYLKEAQ